MGPVCLADMAPPSSSLVLLVALAALTGCTGVTTDSTTPAQVASPTGFAAGTNPSGASGAGSGPANLVVLGVSLDQATVAPGQAIAATVEVRNEGGAAGDATLAILEGSTTLATSAVSVPAGKAVFATLSFSLTPTGNHTLTLSSRGAAYAGAPLSVLVQAPARFAFQDLVILPDVAELGDIVNAKATLVNLGDTPGSARVAFLSGSTRGATTLVDVPASGRVTVSLSGILTTAGDISVGLGLVSGDVRGVAPVHVRSPILANASAQPVSGFCSNEIPFHVTFLNTGDGIARGVNVTLVIRDGTGAVRDTQSGDAGDVLSGKQGSVDISLHVPSQCGTEPKTYSVTGTATPRYGPSVAFETGALKL